MNSWKSWCNYRRSELLGSIASLRTQYSNHKSVIETLWEVEQSLTVPLENETLPSILNTGSRQAVYSLFIAAQVEIDKLEYPNIDPTTGWIKFEQTSFLNAPYCVKTQLLHAYLTPNGEIFSLEYKPRKICLVDPFLPPSFSDSIPGATLSKTEFKVSKQTKDLLSVRFLCTYLLGNKTEKMGKEFLFRAGIGAHLNNSTTGFSIDFWNEEENSDFDLPIKSKIALLTPSAELDALSYRALLPVGGMGAASFEFPQTLTRETITSGIYGIRMIDGVKQFVFDIRYSKEITSATLCPIELKDNDNNCRFQALSIDLAVQKKNLGDIYSPLVLYFSIL